MRLCPRLLIQSGAEILRIKSHKRNLETLTDLHPTIQSVVLRISTPTLTWSLIGQRFGITKQAAQKHFKLGLGYLHAYKPGWNNIPKKDAPPCAQCSHKDKLIQHLRRQLILAGVEALFLKFFRQKVLKFFSRFKPGHLPAQEKKKILDWLEKFKKAGGLIKEFAKVVGKSPETLSYWKEAYKKYGLAGLVNKTTRPKNFGNKIPHSIIEQLILLILQFPKWTPYQYHSYIRNNPATHWYVSLPVIQKIKAAHLQRSEEEKERMIKRWCFAPGTKAWTVDFICIFKTDHFKLQCLTVSDQRSRFLLYQALYLNTSTEIIIRDLEELFIRFGKPDILKADNGPEFRTECRDQLKELSIHFFNSPQYYGQFNGAHERIHRKMRAFIDLFEKHQNLTQLVSELDLFCEQYNYKMPMDALSGKTPAEIFFGDGSFTPKGAEIVTPYEKDGELRMKFTNRDGKLARMSMPLIEK